MAVAIASAVATATGNDIFTGAQVSAKIGMSVYPRVRDGYKNSRSLAYAVCLINIQIA